MKKLFITGLILCLGTPLIVEGVTVNREITPSDLSKYYQFNPVQRSGNGDWAMVDIKNKALLYAKKCTKLPESVLSAPDYPNDCEFSKELNQMGAEDVLVEHIFVFEKNSKHNVINLGGRNFADPAQCTEISYTYNGKPYKTAWCRSTRPHAKSISK